MLNAHFKRMEPSQSYYRSLNLNRPRTARLDTVDTIATSAKHRSKLTARLSSKSFSNMGDLLDMMHQKPTTSATTQQPAIQPTSNQFGLAFLATSAASTRLKEKSNNVLNILNNNYMARSARAATTKSTGLVYSYNLHQSKVNLLFFDRPSRRLK